MKKKIKIFIRTLFRYSYFRIVRLLDIILNSHKPLFPLERIHTVLLVELQDMGDTIIASPCIRQIRKRFPKAAIHMLVQNKYLDMVRYNPRLDKVFGAGSLNTQYPSYSQLFRVSRKIRKGHYDLVMSLNPTVRNNLIAALSGGKIISGYINDPYFLPSTYHDHRIEVRGFKPPEEITYFKEEPMRVRSLKPAASFGIDLTDYIDTELFLPAECDSFAEQFLKTHHIQLGHRLFGIHPTAMNYFKSWPSEKFAELGDRLIEYSRNVRIFLIGSKKDKETLDFILSLMKNREFVICDTTLSILQTASIINRCDVLVGNDSGPCNLSGALGIPTVHIHGPSDPKVGGPGGHKNFPVTLGLSCSPCGLNVHFCSMDKKCMRELEVSKVFDATLQALEKYSPMKIHHV